MSFNENIEWGEQHLVFPLAKGKEIPTSEGLDKLDKRIGKESKYRFTEFLFSC